MACLYTIHLQKDINKNITLYIYSYLQINSFMCIFSIKQEKIYNLQAFIYREKERKKKARARYTSYTFHSCSGNYLKEFPQPLLIRESSRNKATPQCLFREHLPCRECQFPDKTLVANNLGQALQCSNICCQACQ